MATPENQGVGLGIESVILDGTFQLENKVRNQRAETE